MGKAIIRSVLVVVALVLCRPGVAADHWVASWGTAQQLMKPERAIPPAQTPPARIERQTVRMVAPPDNCRFQVRIAVNSFGHGPCALMPRR
jgi:hypothetical protein